jgi:hypothetical protein
MVEQEDLRQGQRKLVEVAEVVEEESIFGIILALIPEELFQSPEDLGELIRAWQEALEL